MFGKTQIKIEKPGKKTRQGRSNNSKLSASSRNAKKKRYRGQGRWSDPSLGVFGGCKSYDLHLLMFYYYGLRLHLCLRPLFLPAQPFCDPRDTLPKYFFPSVVDFWG